MLRDEVLRAVAGGLQDADGRLSRPARIRADCLDWLLILGFRHLDRVLRTYVEHHNRKRGASRTAALAPEGAATVEEVDIVLEMQRRDLLGRLIHKYKTAA